jgi:hypothetical protein
MNIYEEIKVKKREREKQRENMNIYEKIKVEEWGKQKREMINKIISIEYHQPVFHNGRNYHTEEIINKIKEYELIHIYKLLIKKEVYIDDMQEMHQHKAGFTDKYQIENYIDSIFIRGGATTEEENELIKSLKESEEKYIQHMKDKEGNFKMDQYKEYKEHKKQVEKKD